MNNNIHTYHIVQLSTDNSVFIDGINSEFAQRQVKYGKILRDAKTDGFISIVILTTIKYDSIQFGNVNFIPIHVKLKGYRKFFAWHSLYSTLQLIHRRLPIDILTTQTVHDEAWIALIFAKFNKCAIVGQIHYDIFNPWAKATLAGNYIGHIRYILMLRMLKYFSALRVVGKGIAREITNRKLHTNVHVIPVAMALLSSNSSDITLLHQHKDKKVLFVGRLVEQKNLFTWIEIAKLIMHSVPDAKFEIVGDGKLRALLESFASEIGIRDKITFVGYVPYEQLARIYQSAVVFLITSFYEGFGRVVAEALAHQIPVVAPKITGIEDIVENSHSGFLLPANDVNGMANCVIRLLNDLSLAHDMGRHGEEFVKNHFDQDTLAANWIQLLIQTSY